jgi:hypothetical protein
MTEWNEEPVVILTWDMLMKKVRVLPLSKAVLLRAIE